jgi:hypothetical protein
MRPSAGRTASASQQWLDFGAEPSRPASLLCTLRTHQSPGEWQHSLPACSLALAVRDSHPLDFIKWFPLLHCWFLHFHASPSATYRKPRLACAYRKPPSCQEVRPFRCRQCCPSTRNLISLLIEKMSSEISFLTSKMTALGHEQIQPR